MLKYGNFFLMLKQGIKGVFRFKIQFIIILLLTFIATFILSITLSTQKKLTSSYNDVVKKVNRFDYSGQLKVDTRVSDTSDPFLVINMLDNTGATRIIEKDKSGNLKRDNSAYNFILDNPNETYKYVDSNGMLKAYKSFLTEGTKNFISYAKNNPDENFGVDTLMRLFDSYMVSLFTDLKVISNVRLSNGSLDSVETQTKYSPIGMYTYNNPHWFDDGVTFNGAEPVSFDYNDPNKQNQQDPKDDLDMTAASVGQIVTYVKNMVDYYNNNNSTKLKTNADVVAFVFGESLKNTDSSNKWIVTNDNKGYELTPVFDGKSHNFTFADSNNSKNLNDPIWDNGLRGITNPFINKLPSDKTDSTNIVSWNYLGSMDSNTGVNGSNVQSTMNNYNYNDWSFMLGDSESFKDYIKDMISGGERAYNFWTKNFFNPWFTSYTKITAGAADFNFGIRRETDYFDAVNQLKFRAIVLGYNENYGFTIYKGRMPNTGEIAINEQFAKKNNLTVGSNIKIGDAYYSISAIATDAFSYTPSQDMDNPIPNPSVSAFIWGWPPTIAKINGGSAASNNTSDAVDETYSFYLWDKDPDKRYTDIREKAFFAFFSNNSYNLGNNQSAIKSFVNEGQINDQVGTNLKVDSFTKSKYRYSWVLEPLVVKIYDTIVFIAAAIIALIAIISLVVSVKKTVEFNSKQIGILKALGEKPATISVTYLSYSTIILVFIVPIAWVLGTVVQIPFGNLFGNYFSIVPDNVVWDWISIVIAIGVMGILSGFVTFLSAFILTKRPILSILIPSVKWGKLKFIDSLKEHVFKSAPFSTRFSLTLTSSGSKQIILMSVVTLIASFLISICLAIPSVVAKVKSSYYSSINYSNKYSEISMIGNAPLSKNAISYWNGQNYLNSQYVKTNESIDGSDVKFGYYKNPADYTSTITNSDVISQYIYDKANNKFQDSDLYFMAHMDDMIKTFGAMFGNNYFTHLGVSFSIGDIDKLYGVLLHSLTEVKEGPEGGIPDTSKFTDSDKMSEAKELSSWFTTSVPKVINSVIDKILPGASSNGNETGRSWKEQILDVLYAVLPSYVKSYVERSDSRQDQYAISYQNEIYIPGEETLATTVNNSDSIILGKDQSMDLTGLDKYQNSISISSDDIDKTYLPENVKEELYDRINLPIVNGKIDSSVLNKSVVAPNGETLYDGSTHTLNIPIIANKQAESAYKLSPGSVYEGWNNNLQRMQVRLDSNYYDLPQNAWVYDDTDFANYWKNNMSNTASKTVPYLEGVAYNSMMPNKEWTYDVMNNESTSKYYLDAASLDNGKLTFNNQFDKNGSLNDRATLFKDFKTDKNGNINGTYLRPYYQYKNFRLMVPEAWISDKNSFLWNDGYHTADKKETKSWYKEIPYSDVPKSVSDGYQKLAASQSDGKLSWNQAETNNWLVINPYDTDYYKDGYNEQSNREALGNILDGPGYWYRYIFANKGAHPLQVGMNESVKNYFKTLGAAPDIKIDLKSVGSIDSYNDKLVICDSDIANTLLGYSNSRAYQYNRQIFDQNTLVPAGKEYINPKTGDKTVSEYDRWMPMSENQTTDPAFIDHDWKDKKDEVADVWQPSYYKLSNSVLDYAPHKFYNTKYSNIDEPLNLTSQVSFSKSIRVGQSALQLGDSIEGLEVNMIGDSELLSTVRALTNQILGLAISIGAMLVAAIVVTAALLTMLTGDIYIEQYKRFMVLLRAMGYSNTKIMMYTFGTVSVMSAAAWVLGTVIAWVIVFAVVQILWSAGFAIPVGLTWWPIFVSLAVVVVSYVGSLWVSSRRARVINPSAILTQTAE